MAKGHWELVEKAAMHTLVAMTGAPKGADEEEAQGTDYK